MSCAAVKNTRPADVEKEFARHFPVIRIELTLFSLLHITAWGKMFTDVDLNEADEQETISAQTFYKGVIDFIKWTSTLAAAAVLWVGSATASTTGAARILAFASLATLILSLMVAIFSVHRVLTAWAKEWVVVKEEQSLLLIKKLKVVDATLVKNSQEEEQIQKLLKAIDAAKRFQRPRDFNQGVIVHILLVILGLLLYATAQALSSLFP